jgi:hypothetical protein
METLAEDTGGKAFYDTNGLNDALARAVNYGSHYYTLAYTPTDKKMDGRYRRIQVKLSGKYKFYYRRGYYADNAKRDKAKEQPSDPLKPLMTRGLPDFAQILYKIRVTRSNSQAEPIAAIVAPTPSANTEVAPSPRVPSTESTASWPGSAAASSSACIGLPVTLCSNVEVPVNAVRPKVVM